MVRTGNPQEKANAKLAIIQIIIKIKGFSNGNVQAIIVNATIKTDTIFCEIWTFVSNTAVNFSITYITRKSTTKTFRTNFNSPEIGCIIFN